MIMFFHLHLRGGSLVAGLPLQVSLTKDGDGERLALKLTVFQTKQFLRLITGPRYSCAGCR